MASKIDYEITEEDQTKITTFSLMHDKRLKLEQQLEVLNNQTGLISDAQDELLINMETPLYKIGDCFMKLTEQELESELEKVKEGLQEEADKTKERIETCKKECDSLKASLYAKFGSRINLEA
ncbi:prefoldin subunit, putative [Theileria equi strain WA]|uniref:Prefoldin subunit 4 n=1 Tax=Theileria equi strain WA TaxID=1537102 RepID=L0B100_THEEQ|nr:prefoldin subunit, putative [Theileria equi strain WA]AFZ80901.1 prefoldin subunit, putative [Theileria equi strain WA]|eukprot:XP_004830567.1 prefoldin subunit, putative [Theileria equi strain WA]